MLLHLHSPFCPLPSKQAGRPAVGSGIQSNPSNPTCAARHHNHGSPERAYNTYYPTSASHGGVFAIPTTHLLRTCLPVGRSRCRWSYWLPSRYFLVGQPSLILILPTRLSHCIPSHTFLTLPSSYLHSYLPVGCHRTFCVTLAATIVGLSYL